jgi:Flp pilus assembly protein TadD
VAAARSWQKVAEGRPKDPRPRRKAALALAESRGDLKVARDLAQQAVELAPQSVANRAALVRVYIAAKMQASARKELEEAAKLDPNAEIVKTLQQELK